VVVAAAAVEVAEVVAAAVAAAATVAAAASVAAEVAELLSSSGADIPYQIFPRISF
jgi:hypothetical protein